MSEPNTPTLGEGLSKSIVKRHLAMAKNPRFGGGHVFDDKLICQICELTLEKIVESGKRRCDVEYR